MAIARAMVAGGAARTDAEGCALAEDPLLATPGPGGGRICTASGGLGPHPARAASISQASERPLGRRRVTAARLSQLDQPSVERLGAGGGGCHHLEQIDAVRQLVPLRVATIPLPLVVPRRDPALRALVDDPAAHREQTQQHVGGTFVEQVVRERAGYLVVERIGERYHVAEQAVL